MQDRAASMRWITTFLVSLLASASCVTADFDASVRHLRRAVTPQRDGSHLARLFALRQLRDPMLRPLFERAAKRAEWQVQVHAILGLAEIDQRRRVDLRLVPMVAEQAQQAVIANAIDMGMLSVSEMRELLGMEGLRPIARLLLLAELVCAGESVDPAEIARHSGSAPHRVAGLAAILLAQTGDPAAFSAYTGRLSTLPKRDRVRHMMWLLEAARQYEITAAASWARELALDDGVDDDLAYWSVFTTLALDPEAGLPVWNRALGPTPSVRDQVRYGMLLLAAGASIPPAAYDRLTADNEVLRRIVATGRAVSSDADPTGPLVALLDLGHPKSASWAMGYLEELPDRRSEIVYRGIIDDLQRTEGGRAERIDRAVAATGKLAEIDPEWVYRRLRIAEDDSLLQEVLLLGLFESTSPAVGDEASHLRRIGAGRADTLALLLIARHAPALNRDDLSQLSRVAAGGGRVSDGLQAQAAWLFLRHTTGTERALTMVFDEE